MAKRRRRTTQKQRIASRRNLIVARKKRNRRRLAMVGGAGILAVSVGAGVIYGKKLRGHPKKVTQYKPPQAKPENSIVGKDKLKPKPPKKYGPGKLIKGGVIGDQKRYSDPSKIRYYPDRYSWPRPARVNDFVYDKDIGVAQVFDATPGHPLGIAWKENGVLKNKYIGGSTLKFLGDDYRG